MPVTSTISRDARSATIAISGRFDFSLHKEFREAYRHHAGVTEYIINLAGAEYMDSSALGMLLLLREHAQAHKGRVVIRSPGPGIRKVLAIANFDKLFPIE